MENKELRFMRHNMRNKIESAIWNYVRAGKELGEFIRDRHIYLNHSMSFSFDTLQNFGKIFNDCQSKYGEWLTRD